MEFRQVVARRRMVRRYTPDPVAPELLERLLDLARRAPSAGFSQGQHFVVVRDGELRRRVAELAGEAGYTERGFEPWISSAPVLVVPCVNHEDYRRRYAEPDKRREPWPVSYPLMDGGAAFMLLLLAAADEGLATGFLGIHRLAGLKELLGIPAAVEALGVVTLGYAAPDRRSGSLARGWRPLQEVVHLDGWGGDEA